MGTGASPLPFRGGAGDGASPQRAPFADKPLPNPSPEGEGLQGPCFAPAALTLSALAARMLGWRPHEFWAATPAELATALGLSSPGTSGMDRQTLQRLMEHDHGR